ncbi:MAG TPA: pilus assembly protein PilM [Solirubrobacteraceae bacterium]|jgi:type IV pilus assembly protein PilM|nr:pilus assembly protein PilM [Solirubrobacteraceae bacterium]
MPSLSALKPTLTLPSLSVGGLGLPFGGRGGSNVVGLDIQPGYVAAVQARVNGGVTIERAAGAPLAPDLVREGDVLDEQELGNALRELFRDGRLSKRVRVGLANQRTVLRILELPPVTDRKELDAAVRFQAEDQVPMPLASAVLDYHSLGVFDTPNGPRQRVIVVAAQREMVERLLRAVQHAGLRPEGIDLSAFALIRSLYRPSTPVAAEGLEGGEPAERVLYLNVGGLTNMAIAEGTVCRFTRVVGGGLEAMAGEIAERRGIPLVAARALLAEFELPRPGAVPHQDTAPHHELPAEPAAAAPVEYDAPLAGTSTLVLPDPEAVETWALAQDPSAVPPHAAEQGHEEAPTINLDLPPEPERPPASAGPVPRVDPEVRMVLENGIREIVGEVRNSLDFHRSQDGGGDVRQVVLSGPALEMPGFCEALEADLGLAVQREAVRFAEHADPHATHAISPHRLAIATGLATEEAPR